MDNFHLDQRYIDFAKNKVDDIVSGVLSWPGNTISRLTINERKEKSEIAPTIPDLESREDVLRYIYRR